MSKMRYDKLTWQKKMKKGQEIAFEKRIKSNAKKKKKRTKAKFLDECSKKLNADLPISEQWFQALLKEHNLYERFSYNHPFKGFIPDVISFKLRVIIEIDGSIHTKEEIKKLDEKKDRQRKAMGFTVYRIIHNDEEQALKVINEIKELIASKNKIIRIRKEDVEKKREAAPIKKQLEAISRIMGK